MARKQEEVLLKHEGAEKEKSTSEKKESFFYKSVSFTGHATIKAIKDMYRGERRLSKFIGEKLTPGMERTCDTVVSFWGKIGKTLARPFVKIKRGFWLMRQSAALAREQHSSVLLAVGRTLIDGLKRNTWFFKGVLNHAAAAFGIALVIAVVHVMTGLNVAVAVEYDGKPLGYIENEGVYTTASQLLRQRIISDKELTLSIPTFTLALVDSDQIADEDMLVDQMIQSAGKEIAEAKGIYINGKFYGAVADATAIEQAVESLLSKYRTGAKSEVVELVKPVEIKEGLYLTESIVEAESIVSLLQSEVAGETTYTVQAGDTPSGIAKKHGIAYSVFKSMNPDCETKFVVGQKVYLSKSEPFMQVQVTRRETYKQEIMFETETTKDSSKSTSYTAIVQNGRKGINEVTADVQYINGVEVGRTVVDTKTLQTVVNQKIIKGTKMPSGASGSALNTNGTALGNLHFIWPVAGGEISSHFGYRWGTIHGGLDIRAPRGTAVYAAESGTVELSRWYSGYGYCVIINHGNGIKTLYGHASQLVAKQGQQVKKGDVIMLVGMTGQATGNHLHFEIRTNGTRINPLPYIGR